MTINDAKQIRIIDYLHTLGHNPMKQQNGNFWYNSPLRQESQPSFKVNIKLNLWFDFGIHKGGNIIALAQELYASNDLSYLLKKIAEQTTLIHPISFSFGQYSSSQPKFQQLETKPLSSPALYNYLQQRGINARIAERECKEVRFINKGKNYFAIGFMNDMKGYELRNPYFKGCTSKSISTINNHSDTCIVFEGFMDYLSYLTLNQVKDLKIDFAILNSVANISKALEFITSHQKIYTYLDNDEAGIKTTQEIKKSCSEVYDESHQYNGYKDLNEMLCNRKH